MTKRCFQLQPICLRCRLDLRRQSRPAGQTGRRGADKPATRVFLLSRRFAPERLLEIVRTHWDIENGQPWALDVVFDEDGARNRKDNGPANLAVLRRMAMNIARAHPDPKSSLRRKLLRAEWDDKFLFELIRHMR